MANEISVTANLSASKGGASITPGSKSKTITMAGTNMISSTQSIGTTSELVIFGDITGAPEYVFITNLDTENYVEIGGDSGLTVWNLKLKPGYPTLIPLSSATLYAKANTATCQILVSAVES
jgi:hypothetical protein